MPKPFYIIAEMSKVETLADQCLKFTFRTNEVSPESLAEGLQLHGKQGWLVFKAEEIQAEDIADLPEPEPMPGEKHPSQRLRATLYVLWEQAGGNNRKDKKTFEQFYREQMERFIEAVKDKLAPNN